MRRWTIVKTLMIGAIAAVLGGAALAEQPPEPSKGPAFREGPRARYAAVMGLSARKGSAPGLPPGADFRPFPIVGSDGDQTLSMNAPAAQGLSFRSGGGGGAAVASASPQMRLEESLKRIADELR